MSEAGRDFVAMSPLERAFESKSDEGEEGKERSNGEGGDKVVLIVKHLDMKRHGVGLTADVTGNDADRSNCIAACRAVLREQREGILGR